MGVTRSKWWRVLKLAAKIGLKVGRVKERDRILEIGEAVETVIEAATETPATTTPTGYNGRQARPGQ
jgi:hypothetical protein